MTRIVTNQQLSGTVRLPSTHRSNVRDEEVADTAADDRADDDDSHGLEPHRQQRNPSAARQVSVAACAYGSECLDFKARGRTSG
ncbi:hypothetical protein IFM12275_30610 [Nocardia sputorum]|nr:hypothetical protein IFM12275_30610 [Nocardia sputorum]